ncbi:diacylglycerol/lipid kinase family protein [Serinicoccus sp. LYQ131]|uniref:diacylglycerol/lipid kinase family protein n=1 Tax=Serinicoccus sp. LYQ131 TaxID=3378797 RepID=UPI003851A370
MSAHEMSAPEPADPRVLVLSNPGAGSSEEDVVERVCRVLRQHSPSGVQVCRPGPDQEYAEVVATAVGRDVVVLGGDGSVHRLLQALHDQDLLGRVGAIGVVPMGTGNDLARGADLPLDPEEAAVVAATGSPVHRELVLDDEGVITVNAVHAGVGAEATAQAGDVKGVLGAMAYGVGALQAGLTSRGWNLRVVVDDEVVADGTDPVLLVTLALGPSVGGGTPVAPDARPGDGVVEVLVAHGVSPLARVGLAADLRSGRHVEREDVSLTSGRSVRIEAVAEDDAFRVNTDGEVAPERTLARSWRMLDQGWTLRGPQQEG